jgi:hypothetical protein
VSVLCVLLCYVYLLKKMNWFQHSNLNMNDNIRKYTQSHKRKKCDWINTELHICCYCCECFCCCWVVKFIVYSIFKCMCVLERENWGWLIN